MYQPKKHQPHKKPSTPLEKGLQASLGERAETYRNFKKHSSLPKIDKADNSADLFIYLTIHSPPLPELHPNVRMLWFIPLHVRGKGNWRVFSFRIWHHNDKSITQVYSECQVVHFHIKAWSVVSLLFSHACRQKTRNRCCVCWLKPTSLFISKNKIKYSNVLVVWFLNVLPDSLNSQNHTHQSYYMLPVVA